MKTIFDHDIAKLPAYIFFAKMGKKVLRPGGIGLSRQLLAGVPIRSARVLEFAPGRGATARLVGVSWHTKPASRYSTTSKNPWRCWTESVCWKMKVFAEY